MPLDPLCKFSEFFRLSWVNYEGLVTTIPQKLSKPPCISVSELGSGTFSVVYRLEFADGTDVACSISQASQEEFDPYRKRSELATMAYVRESGLYPSIPVPKVHTWDLTFDNPVGAPYFVMDVVQGRILRPKPTGPYINGFDALSPDEQVSVTAAIARLKASLARPLQFDKIGSLMQSEDGKFYIGKLSTKDSGGPYSSLADVWYDSLEQGIMSASKKLGQNQDGLVHSYNSEFDTIKYTTPHRIASTFAKLSALVPHFVPPPKPYLSIVLHHPDIALRNVFFDPEDLSKIVGVIDWADAELLPLVLASQYPEDLISRFDSPILDPNRHRPEGWRNVPHDWTSMGDESKYEKLTHNGEPMDLKPVVASQIRLFYLRQLFSSVYSREITTIWGDFDIGHAHIFMDAPYYLKFHEIVRGYVEFSREQEDWVSETFYRMMTLPHQPGSLVIGPNVYRGSVQAPIYDLGKIQGLEARDEKVHISWATSELDPAKYLVTTTY